MDRQKYRELLESNKKEITLTLDQFIRWFEEDEQMEKDISVLEDALYKISTGANNPIKIANDVLKEYRGE